MKWKPTLHDLVCASCVLSHHFSPLLWGPRFPECEDVPTHRNLPPYARSGILCKAITRVHHQYTVCRQAVHLSVWCSPFRCLLLEQKFSYKPKSLNTISTRLQIIQTLFRFQAAHIWFSTCKQINQDDEHNVVYATIPPPLILSQATDLRKLHSTTPVHNLPLEKQHVIRSPLEKAGLLLC